MNIDEWVQNVESTKVSDSIDHPQHYNADGRLECIKEMELMFGPCEVASFCKLNAYKYFYRAGSKEGEAKEKDLAKAQWYLDYVAGLMNH